MKKKSNISFLWARSRRKIIPLKLVLLVMLIFTGSVAFSEISNPLKAKSNMLFGYSAQQTKREITGIITDKTGVPLGGVTIYIKGSTIGTLSGNDGKFKLSIPDNTKSLSLSFIGMNPMEVPLTAETTYNVQMEASTLLLEEVVVTGFGTQKKVNVTGAVATVQTKNIISAGVSNVTTALIGKSSGISGLQVSGEPGRNGTNMFIRGRSTLGSGGTDPLIVIDGIEQATEQAYSQLNNMDPNEIESVSILKDAASTAVYGIRGANGVIIVTTKRGSVGAAKISVTAGFGYTEPTNLVKTANSYDWALMRNEAIAINRDQLGDASKNNFLMSPDQLWKFQNNRDYTAAEVDAMTQLSQEQKDMLMQSKALWYGSTDFINQTFNHKGPEKQINVNITGGTEKAKYFTSIGYFNEGSILGNTTIGGSNTGSTFKRLNYRTNIDLKPTDNLEIGFSSSAQFGTTSGFGGLGSQDARYRTLLQWIQEGPPYMMSGIIDDKLISNWAGSGARNPLGAVTQQATTPLYTLVTSGQGIMKTALLTNTVRLKHKLTYITEGLSVRGSVSYEYNFQKNATIYPSIPSYTVTRDQNDPNNLLFFGGALSSTNFSTSNGGAWNKLYVDGGLDYAKEINKHNITLLALWKASLYSLPTGGNFNTPSGVTGFVGRATYNYNDRYMAEFSMGYNGTEQFAKGKRFGFFPSFSAGWVISEEEFFPKVSWMNFLKIRANYGKVGSDNLGGRRYLYLPGSFNQNVNGYYLGLTDGTVANPYYKGTTESSIGNPAVTWEKSTKQGVGLESKFFNSRLSFTADLFKENRTDILIVSPLTSFTYGVSNPPPTNVGETSNHGYELALEWNDKKGDFYYSIGGSLSFARNKIEYQAEVPNPYYWQNVTGLSIGQYRGLKADGFFNTPEELAARPYFSYTSNKQVIGDIRYKDINGDGIIDDKDIVPIGYNNLPEYSYNTRIELGYKGFSINALFIGTKNGSFYLNRYLTQQYYKDAGMAYQWQFNDRWTPEKAATGAEILYPRPNINSSIDPSGRVSDFWLRSTDFVRLKNLSINYTVPASFLKRLNLEKNTFRVYVNGTNLWTLKNPLKKYGIDPEMTDQNTSFFFPLTRVLLVGINITL